MFQRRAAAGFVLTASVFALTACNFQAPDVTQTEHSEVQGSDYTVGSVHVAAVFVTPVETSETATPLYVVATFVNDATTPDTLTAVSSPAGPVTLSGPGVVGGQLTLPPGVPVQIQDPALLAPGPQMTIGVTKLPATGGYVPISFTFGNAGATPTLQAPVVPAGETEDPTTELPTDKATPPPGDTGPQTSD